MGLDLYLYTQSKPDSQLGEQLPRTEVAYFRKFNALLKWVDTYVKEVKNCEDVILDKHKLQKLLYTLKSLNPENCQELFPTTEGFFFGSTEYDEWYWKDVTALQAVVSKLLKRVDFSRMVVCFHAWW